MQNKKVKKCLIKKHRPEDVNFNLIEKIKKNYIKNPEKFLTLLVTKPKESAKVIRGTGCRCFRKECEDCFLYSDLDLALFKKGFILIDGELPIEKCFYNSLNGYSKLVYGDIGMVEYVIQEFDDGVRFCQKRDIKKTEISAWRFLESAANMKIRSALFELDSLNEKLNLAKSKITEILLVNKKDKNNNASKCLKRKKSKETLDKGK